MFYKKNPKEFEFKFDDTETFEKNKTLLSELTKLKFDIKDIRSLKISDSTMCVNGCVNLGVTVNNELHFDKILVESSFRQPTIDEVCNIFKLPTRVLECLFVIEMKQDCIILYAKDKALKSYVNQGLQEKIKNEKSDDSIISYILRGYEKIGFTKEILEVVYQKAVVEDLKITSQKINSELSDNDKKLKLLKKALEKINNSKTAIHCPSEKLAVELLTVANLIGLKWKDGESYTNNCKWDKHKENTLYHLYAGTYGSKNNCSNYVEFEGIDKLINTKPETKTIEEIVALYCIGNTDDAIENIKNIKDVAQSWYNNQKQYQEIVEKIKTYNFEKPVKRHSYDVKNSTFFLLARLEGIELKYLESGGDDQYYDLVTISAWDGYELAIPVPVLAEYIEMSTQDIYDAFENIGKVFERNEVEFI